MFDQPHKYNAQAKKPQLLKPVSMRKDTAIEDQDSNKLWVIVKYMTVDGRTNEYKLTGGEIIKLGRVKFVVREIQTSEDENQTDDDSFDNNIQ